MVGVQQESDKSHDITKGTERPSLNLRSGFDRRIQQIKISKDRRTYIERRTYI